MKSKKNKTEEQQGKIRKASQQKHLNPFKDRISGRENREIVKEEITGEQQRKEAMTERA